jgi:hypothetical protein
MVFIVTSFDPGWGCGLIVEALGERDNRENRDLSVDFYGCSIRLTPCTIELPNRWRSTVIGQYGEQCVSETSLPSRAGSSHSRELGDLAGDLATDLDRGLAEPRLASDSVKSESIGCRCRTGPRMPR